MALKRHASHVENFFVSGVSVKELSQECVFFVINFVLFRK